MSRLPQELVSHIADFLPDDRPLAQYATISRSWQHAIERRTFRAVNVSSAQLNHFAATVSPTPAADRRRLVRCVTYTVVLPLCLPPDAPRESGMHVNDDFTKAITSLFGLLASWRTSTDSSQSLALRIRASCSDPCHDHNVDRGVSTLRSVLKLVPPTTTALQPVPRVTSIDFGSSSSSSSSNDGSSGQQWYRIDGTAAARICAALPDLQDAKLPVSDVSAHLVSAFARGSTRRGIADALADLPRSLTSLCIDVPDFVAPPFRAVAHASSSSSSSSPPSSPGRGGGGHQLSSTGVPRANFVDDPLSAALHALSLLPSMTTMRIGGALAVSPCLFWPADLPLDVVSNGLDSASSPPSSQPSSSHSHSSCSSSSSSSSDAKPAMLPFWPRLQTLTLSFSPTTLSGTPYVTTVPRGAGGGGAAGAGAGTGPATTANPDTVNPLFLAAALAATRMPRLRLLEAATAAGRGCGAASLAVGFAGVGVEAPAWVGEEGKGEEEQGERVWIRAPGVELDGRVEDVWAARVGRDWGVRWV